jgi:hypothetical protein
MYVRSHEGPSFAGRHQDRDAALHRARHMDPKASSTRDSTQRDGKAGRSDGLRGVGPVDLRWPIMIIRVI